MNQQFCPKKRLVKLLTFIYLLGLHKVQFGCTFPRMLEYIYNQIYMNFISQIRFMCEFFCSALARDLFSAPVQPLQQVFLFFYSYAELKNMYFFIYIYCFLSFFLNKDKISTVDWFWFVELIYTYNVIHCSELG